MLAMLCVFRVDLQLEFSSLSASSPAHALFPGSRLQTPAVQVVWHNSEVMLLYYVAGSGYLDAQNRRELIGCLKQKNPKSDIAVHGGSRWVFIGLIKLILFIFIWYSSDRSYKPGGSLQVFPFQQANTKSKASWAFCHFCFLSTYTQSRMVSCY